jgi:DNA repair photolyase
MKTLEIESKTIITRQKSGNHWFAYDYNMNLYRGCIHGCIYCDSRSECYGIDNFEEIKVKVNAIDLLKEKLMKKRNKGIIGMGSMSDPYNPVERKYLLTRRSLELIREEKFGVFLITKSDLVLRDMSILSDINKNHKAIVGLTITTFDDELALKIEPHVTKSSMRFEAIRKLSDDGITAGVLLMPVLPFINDNPENIINIVKAAATSGAKFIYPWFGVTLRQNQRDYFYERLDENFPGIKAKYVKTFGYKYSCDSPNSEELYQVFQESCEEHGILYRMEDINKLFVAKPEFEQLSLL